MIELPAVERNKIAIQFRDKGDIDGARKVLLDNSSFLRSGAARYKSSRLNSYADEITEDAKQLEEKEWNMNRKQMRQSQYQRATQQN